MKHSDKTKTTLVATTLLVGAIFMLSVTIQRLPSTTVFEKPVNETKIIDVENQYNPIALTE
ncbi:MAG: hypothetical protein H8D58_01875 [Candidatus Marinimicrobia bacterium]|nr:hypothetical protein [Candidatus Neomarinimicrobiota bacterium]